MKRLEARYRLESNQLYLESDYRETREARERRGVLEKLDMGYQKGKVVSRFLAVLVKIS